MKPFSLQDALAGKPVVTRDGRKVTSLHKFEDTTQEFSLAGVVEGLIETFTSEGKYVDDADEYGVDLFMASTQKTLWVNLYQAYPCTFSQWDTEEMADYAASSNRIGGKAHPIVIEE